MEAFMSSITAPEKPKTKPDGSQAQDPLLRQFLYYTSQMRAFKSHDWTYYVSWVGLMLGLLASTSGFLLWGWAHGVHYPPYVWNVPVGTAIFIGAIALDTIGHRTMYAEYLEEGEGFVHEITISLGVSSVVVLCLAYSHASFFRIPALVLIAMTIFYSVVDEAMHWRRYLAGNSGRVEMWSHVFIFLGHIIMCLSWWHWFEEGYPGVAETLRTLP
jgi:hypothetical protein